MKNTYLDVPKAQTDNYAQGYTNTDTPIRMPPGVLASEAYGIRTTADDLLRFVEAANPATELDPPLQPQDDVLINKIGSTNGFAATWLSFPN
jgi:beta-lactamase class C